MISCDISPSLTITEKTLGQDIHGVRCVVDLFAVGKFTRKEKKIYGEIGGVAVSDHFVSIVKSNSTGLLVLLTLFNCRMLRIWLQF
jgi:hypothetical protein